MLQAWLKNAWLVILAIWEPLHRLIVAFRWPVAFAVVALGSVALGFFWWEGFFTPKKTIDDVRVETVRKLSEVERKYIAVAIIRDALVESEPERVQEAVALSVLNFHKEYGIDIPTIVRNSLTQIPLNSNEGPAIPTISTYVLYREANSGQRTVAYAMADKIITKRAAGLSDKALACSTQYIRKPRKTWKPSTKVTAVFTNAAEFKEVPKPVSANPGEARFFCPTKKK